MLLLQRSDPSGARLRLERESQSSLEQNESTLPYIYHAKG